VKRFQFLTNERHHVRGEGKPSWFV
jgi:hypothetical protein